MFPIYDWWLIDPNGDKKGPFDSRRKALFEIFGDASRETEEKYIKQGWKLEYMERTEKNNNFIS